MVEGYTTHFFGGIIMIARSPIYQPLIRGFTSVKACQFHQQPRQRNSWSTLQAACRRYPHVFTVILLDSSCASGFISIFLGSTLYFCLFGSSAFLAVLSCQLYTLSQTLTRTSRSSDCNLHGKSRGFRQIFRLSLPPPWTSGKVWASSISWKSALNQFGSFTVVNPKP
jgi:hypothetical protein